MSSSEDDVPLANGAHSTRLSNRNGHRSSKTIPPSLDKAMDKANPTPKNAAPNISIRNGPVLEVQADGANAKALGTNGRDNGKRKARSSTGNRKSYKEDTDEDEDEEPLSKRRRVTAAKAKSVSDMDSDDAPLATKKGKSAVTTVLKKPPKVTAAAIGESEDSDTPLGTKLAKEKAIIEKRAEKEAVDIRRKEKRQSVTNAKKRSNDYTDDEDEPQIKKQQRKQQPNGTPVSASKKKKHVNGFEKEESDDDVPLARKRPAKKANGVKKEQIDEETLTARKGAAKKKAEPSSAKKGQRNKAVIVETEQDQEAEEQEEEYHWWEDPAKGDGTVKWKTLEHAGVVFPPPYEPLPKNVKLLYNGTPVSMSMDAEEIAGFFGSMLNSTHNVENPTFQKNFFTDFQNKLQETGGAIDTHGTKVNINEFSKCDFRSIFDYYEGQRSEKKGLPGAEKKRIKAEKDSAEAPYMFCMWDGRKQKVGNFRVEPPGLFRGRGEHPKTGMVKKRVMPEQVTINIGKEAKVPQPPEGHKWKEVKHDDKGTWLAMWQENINQAYKYVMLAANSDVKGQSDYKKFEKARELKKHIDRIRKDYGKELKDKVMANRQRATAVYLIDKFALRAGNEKGDDEADTVGCCSLKYEHVTLKPPNIVIFDFLGKDSIRFYDEVEVEPQVFKNLKIFKKEPKNVGDEIFDRLKTDQLNKHLSNYMPGLTAKVFRTYNASFTMANLLRKMKSSGSIAEKIKDYNDANRKVAILCNHKRTVAAGHGAQMEKMTNQIKALKYQKWRIKQMMIDIDSKIKKKKGADWFEIEEGIDKDWILEHQKSLVEAERQKIEKKFAKDNEKLIADGETEMKESELEERLAATEELAEKFKKENKTSKVEAEGKGPTIERLEANLDKLDEKINAMLFQAADKENNKEVALGTSKINYIDPRLTVVFSKKFGVPIEKFFSKTLREKFEWAVKSVDENWEF